MEWNEDVLCYFECLFAICKCNVKMKISISNNGLFRIRNLIAPNSKIRLFTYNFYTVFYTHYIPLLSVPYPLHYLLYIPVQLLLLLLVILILILILLSYSIQCLRNFFSLGETPLSVLNDTPVVLATAVRSRVVCNGSSTSESVSSNSSIDSCFSTGYFFL